MHSKIHMIWDSITPLKTNMEPENRPSQKETIVLQPSIFRCYVSFREGISRPSKLHPSGFPSGSHWNPWIASTTVEALLIGQGIGGFGDFPNGFRLDLRVELETFLWTFRKRSCEKHGKTCHFNYRRYHSGSNWMHIRRVVFLISIIALSDCWIRGGCLFVLFFFLWHMVKW